MRSKLEDGTKIINKEHPLFKQYYNIAIQELTNMAQAVNVMFKTNANGNPILTNGDFEFSDTYNNKPEHFIINTIKMEKVMYLLLKMDIKF